MAAKPDLYPGAQGYLAISLGMASRACARIGGVKTYMSLDGGSVEGNPKFPPSRRPSDRPCRMPPECCCASARAFCGWLEESSAINASAQPSAALRASRRTSGVVVHRI
jgi:hypothetical protein